MSDADEPLSRFVAECEAMTAIELEDYLAAMRLSPEWALAARKVLYAKWQSPNDSWRDRVALFLWRDRDGYDPTTSRVTDAKNVSLRTRFREVRAWLAAGWKEHWRYWITTLIAAAAAFAAITALYLNAAKSREKVDADTRQLLRECIEKGKCIVRIEPVR